MHALAKTRASFDDPNLISHVGLVPLAALTERAGLHELAAQVRPAGDRGANAALKIACLAAGMAAGANSPGFRSYRLPSLRSGVKVQVSSVRGAGNRRNA